MVIFHLGPLFVLGLDPGQSLQNFIFKLSAVHRWLCSKVRACAVIQPEGLVSRCAYGRVGWIDGAGLGLIELDEGDEQRGPKFGIIE